MKSIKVLAVLSALFVFQSANAYSVTFPESAKKEIEEKSLKAAENYAQSVGKAAPQPSDYKYGMKLDVAKLIYITPTVKFCGNVNKLMTYEDSQGDLHTIRYISQGQCRNQK
ncbi:DUF2790 domain-containing protein [Pseudomonas sp. GD03721]|nr:MULTISPECIES: DUF2790 domain-containing protein [unclassified Pseudomonas]MDG0898674.1 DUF2790 domain-containing protein [Pseudomonas sp. L01]MDH1442858.1 DUF2790 domain-containing protein [Pseudomonas sp. GD03722]WGG02095.1 DUF2790 domain-containing protein [Pseudomonas sp. GD03721]WGG06263.1 DUF2790 domain-containing protein [Pseudomonas sp. GD03919]